MTFEINFTEGQDGVGQMTSSLKITAPQIDSLPASGGLAIPPNAIFRHTMKEQEILPSDHSPVMSPWTRRRADDHERKNDGDEDEIVYELSTPFNGRKAQFGAMFDVRSLPNNVVRIDSLSIHTLEKIDGCEIQVFTKEGSFEYFEEESSVWKRIVSMKTFCRGPGRHTVIPLEVDNKDDVRIGRSDRRAFYVRIVGTQIIYSVASQSNKIYTEDDHMQIFTGVAVADYFKDFWTPRMLNVAVSYIVERLWNGSISVGGQFDSFGEPIDSNVCTNTLTVITPDGVTKNFGLMFNVKSNSESDLKVFGIGFFIDSSASIDYDIYTIDGGFEHGSASMSLWTMIAQGTVEEATKGTMIMILGSDFAPVTFRPGETHGFYITLHTENLRYHTSNVRTGNTFMQNRELIVSVGSGVNGYPLGDDTQFLPRRAMHGKILYGIDRECRNEIEVTYTFLVQFPKGWSLDEMYNDVNIGTTKVLRYFIENDVHLKEMVQTFDLKLASVYSQHDQTPPAICSISSEALSCDAIITQVFFNYDGHELDEGQVIYKVLKHIGTIVNNLNSGSLIVTYTGEELLQTDVMITLTGVPVKKMTWSEIVYFQSTTKGFLDKKKSGTVEFLSVEVLEQSLLGGLGRRFLEDTTSEPDQLTTIDIRTKVSGKHQPPSPGLVFDELVEDSINAEDGSFKEELKTGGTNEDDSGADYFTNVREVYAKPLNIHPTKPPTLQYNDPSNKSGGISSPIIIAFIIGAALLTFGLVFGAFVLRKRQRDRKRFSVSIFDEDEDDPLFFDFENKKNQNNTTIIPPYKFNNRKGSSLTVVTEDVTEDTRSRHSRGLSSTHLSLAGSRPKLYDMPRHNSQKSDGSRSKGTQRSRESNRSGSRSGSERFGDSLDGPVVKKDRMTKHYSTRSLRNADDDDYQNYEAFRSNSRSMNILNDHPTNTDREGEAYRGSSRSRSRSRDIADAYEERIREKSYRSQSQPRDVVDDYEDRIRNKSYRSQSQPRDVVDDYEDRIRNKSYRSQSQPRDVVDDYEDTGRFDNLRSHHQQTSRRFADEHEERIRQKYENDRTDFIPSSRNVSTHDVPRSRSVDTFDRDRQNTERDRKESRRERGSGRKRDNSIPVHDRFKRRPSEDGDGISIASASTSSTLSSHFTRLNKQNNR